MLLDIRTTIMIAAGLGLLVALSLRYVLRDYPAMLGPSMREWMLGVALQALSWALTEFRDVLPDFVTVVVSNALLSVGYALLVDAVRRFMGCAPGNRALIALVCISITVQIFFTYAVPSTRLRILFGSLMFGSLLLFALGPLLDPREPRRRAALLTASAFAFMLAVMLARFVHEAFDVAALRNAFQTTPMQTLVFGSLTFFPAIATLGFMLMCIDRLHRELEQQARVDALTGVLSRRTLDELAAHALAAAHRQQRPLAALLIDADHFKEINDAWGHDVGDEALRALANALRDALRRGEDLLGRLGGEEFVAVLPDTDAAAARASAERLRVAVEQATFEVAGRRVPLHVSIGVALAEMDDDLPALLRRADRAMYAAKSAGRNCVIGPQDTEFAALSIGG